MKLYLDADFRCHLTSETGRTEVEVSYFDGKCQAYIEGYRFVPDGETWVREDGVMFQGEMIAPWKSWEELDAAQRAYERELAETLSAENAALLSDMAQLVEEVYQSDMEMMGI